MSSQFFLINLKSLSVNSVKPGLIGKKLFFGKYTLKQCMWSMSGDKTLNKNLWKNLYFFEFQNWKNKTEFLGKNPILL